MSSEDYAINAELAREAVEYRTRTAPALPRSLARKPGTGTLGLTRMGYLEMRRDMIRSRYEGPTEDYEADWIASEMADHAEYIRRNF